VGCGNLIFPSPAAKSNCSLLLLGDRTCFLVGDLKKNRAVYPGEQQRSDAEDRDFSAVLAPRGQCCSLPGCWWGGLLVCSAHNLIPIPGTATLPCRHTQLTDIYSSSLQAHGDGESLVKTQEKSEYSSSTHSVGNLTYT
jgi:hypothetical protein